MATLKWALTCQRVLTDRDKNTVTYVEAVEELSANSVPAQMPPIVVATVWEREFPGEVIAVRVRGITPSGEELGSIVGSLEAPEARRHRANFELSIVAQEFGSYIFVVEQRRESKWVEEARVVIAVYQSEGEAAEEVQKPTAEATTHRRRRRR